jgi:disulfide bond formation protein DsbB
MMPNHSNRHADHSGKATIPWGAFLLSPPLAILVLLSAASGALAAAFASEIWGGLAPCEMCWWQRWAHVATLLILWAGILAVRRTSPSARAARWRDTALALAALTALVGAGLALFHVGVEQKWWTGLTRCAAAAPSGSSLDALRAAMLSAPIVRCDEPAWSFGGLSMAAINGLLSLAMGIYGLCVVLRRSSRSKVAA